MMKTLVVSMMCCAAVICTGCGKKSEESKKPEITAIDTTAAEAQFRSATPEVRAIFQGALSAMKAGKNAEAEDALRKLLQNGRLTPDQERTARELMIKVQG